MKKILFVVLLCIVSAGAAFGQKKVAILETIDREDKVPYGVELLLRSGMTVGVANTPGFEAYDRVDLSGVFGEQDFQRTGNVTKEQIHQLGKMTGVSYVLITEAAMLDANNVIITAKIVDVETAKVENVFVETSSTNSDKLAEACKKLAMKLLGVYGGSDVPVRQGGSANYGGGLPRANYKETGCGLQMSMVYVQGGEFMMGGTSEQGSEAGSYEFPVRKVTVGNFYIGQYEVTQGEWSAVMGTSIAQQRDKAKQEHVVYVTRLREIYGAEEIGEAYDDIEKMVPLQSVGSDYPMCYVSWEEASEFCRILSRRTGRTYRLPTEAEWEYAARGGRRSEGYKYSGSNMIDYVGWYSGNSGNTTHPVGTKTPNELDIYDMSGNVLEWCRDWFGGYDSSDVNNPSGPSSGSGRVVRGGAIGFEATLGRVTCRGTAERSCFLGFRVVCIP